MDINRVIQGVMSLYREIEAATGALKADSGLKCIPGCGYCCKHQGIDAAPAEYLPLADALYRRGKALEWLDLLRGEENDSPCFLLNPGEKPNEGTCKEYEYRGLVCRLFGFSTVLDKFGASVFSTCRIIKTAQPEAYQRLTEKIASGCPSPIMKNYFFRLYDIDALSARRFPVNTAIRVALETILSHYAYSELSPLPPSGNGEPRL